jgi:hypothetical protein
MKTKPKAKTPVMGTAELVDEIGRISAIVADFEKKKKAFVAELLTRAGDRKYIDGNLYTATIVPECTVTSLDTDFVKTEMGDEWFAAHTKDSTRKASVRVTARKTPDQKKE